MMNTRFVGIDVSKRNNVVRFTDSQGDTLPLFHAPNNKICADTILEKFHDTILHSDFQAVSIGMESTSVYADHLAVFLRSDSLLKKWDVKVFILNAKQVEAFKEAYPDLPKNNNIDALSSLTTYVLVVFPKM